MAAGQLAVGCLFCKIGAGQEASGLPENEIFARCEVAYAKPALGQFVEGYSLIVPFAHECSLSCFEPEELEVIENFKNEIASLLGRAYAAPIRVFEHGCGQSGRARAGSCIDHAHLHLVPVDVRLKPLLCRRFPWRRLGGLAELASLGRLPFGYIYLEEEGERILVELDREVPSQFLRRLIGHLKSVGRGWDWRSYPFRERIEAFNARMARLCAR